MRRGDFSVDAMPGRLLPIPAHGPNAIAFVPNPIPRTLHLPPRISRKIEEAGLLLGRLSVGGQMLDPWVQIFLRRDAIASNAIEGTFTTARDLYLFEAAGVIPDARPEAIADTREVANYTRAMQAGLEGLKSLPMCLRLVRDMHRVLLEGPVRGRDKRPGEFRQDQNLIGSSTSVEQARFVPPPVPEMHEALADLEAYLHEPSDLPNIVRLALIHYQFETIHPFDDGNGRLGRLLIPLLLCTWGVLPQGTMPRLYLSAYLEQHDEDYRDLMLAVSQRGEWEPWVEFFVDAVRSEAEATWDLAQRLNALRAEHWRRVSDDSKKLARVVDMLFSMPALQVRDIKEGVKVSRQQAQTYANRLVELGILVPGQEKYGRFYFASEVLAIFYPVEPAKPAAANPPSVEAAEVPLETVTDPERGSPPP